MSHLHSLGERIHSAADELPLTNVAHSGSDNLDDLDESVRAVAGLFIHLTTAAAFADRTARSSRGPEGDVLRRKATGLTHTVGILGRALADLGEAVVQAGLLHQLGVLPRSPERRKAVESAHSLLDRRIDSSRRHLYEAGRQLHYGADRLTTAPLVHPTPAGPSAATAPRPALPRPAARTR
ncbi:hypothetical protein ACFYN0_01260 [Streptomyces sp. NPDC006704]|uniref:hypothetical protein n=1 Tax=Streptomyces sp. NPDC006704 TaxID=3364760 RepID=UPI0036C5ACA3